ncbi:MAG: SGNH/GDSL hydrolase family protein, partial [bacterium]
MNPLFAFFAGGSSAVYGFVILFVAIGVELIRPPGKLIWRWSERVLALTAAVFILAGSPPAAGWLLAGWVVFFILWRLESNSGFLKRFKLRIPVIAVFLFLSLLLGFNLITAFLAPPGLQEWPPRVVVIGDSLTAGIAGDGVDQYWPQIVARQTGAKVEILARPGALLADGRWQLDNFTGSSNEKSVYLVLLGGNDILGPADPRRFSRDLDDLYSALEGELIYAFEIPLPPFNSKFALIQQRLAAAYEVNLIPRRYLAALLAGKDNTIDGIHLNSEG